MGSTFKFEARDATGRTVRGTLSAGSQNEVVADLRRRNLTPIDISKGGGLFSRLPRGTNRV